MEPIRVMCIDDNQLVAESLGRRLRIEPDLKWEGWYQRPEALLARIAAQAPDVLLVDIDMPGVDSFTLCEQIKELAPGTRVAILTGHARREYFDRAVDAGVDGYLCKDEDPAALIDGIRRLSSGDFVVSPELGFA